MTWIIKFARYNELAAVIFGISSNLLLLYLIITVDKSKMKNISRILLQNCFLDMFLAFMALLTGHHTVSINKIYFHILDSPLWNFGFEYASIFISLFSAAIIVCMQAAPVPFFIRYYAICKDKTITTKHLIGSYILVFLCFIITFTLMIWCYPPNEKIYEPYKAATLTEFWLDEFPTGPVFVARETDARLLALLSFVFPTTFVSYSLVLFFSINISRRLKSHASSFKQSKILNKQLHWTLICQAIGPVIVGNISALALIIMMGIQYENNYISIACSSVLAWTAVVNPLAAIIIMTPYQKRVKTMFGIKTTASVVNISTTNLNSFHLHSHK